MAPAPAPAAAPAPEPAEVAAAQAKQSEVAPPVPTSTDPEVQQKSVDLKKQLRKSGRGQTILTSPTGVASTGTTMSKTLLGA
jgi:hypothetical protein